ncbi:MAG: NUDIX domain-containing protein [Candidatus Symbiothrix sp.]|jgi:hypothetical protein|nr:NUDIX domain-containing protein [Candidatus Symbiothrix sp.]
MTQFYRNEDKHFVSVDCIILGFKENAIHVLIIKRKFDPLKGERSLMGGFIRKNESLNDTVSRVVKEYTGIENVYWEQVGAYGDVGRDVAERVISIVHYALIDMELFDETLMKKYSAEWVNVNAVGPLILDHNRLLADTLKLLRRRTATRPVGFSLLPEKFTLPQLQLLYEAIYQTSLDKRNFRKKIFEMDILEKLDEKDKNASKRGAYYYRFNKEKYDRRLEDGAVFSFI